ncbi:MAG: hypothetical protein ACLFNT_02600 [Spirochaetales bacterium]
MERRHFEVVIGSGQGGFPLAMKLAEYGEETATALHDRARYPSNPTVL